VGPYMVNAGNAGAVSGSSEGGGGCQTPNAVRVNSIFLDDHYLLHAFIHALRALSPSK